MQEDALGMGGSKKLPPAPQGWADTLAAYLTGGVNYFRSIVLTAVFDHFAESVLNSRVVAVDEKVVHKLHCQGGFA